MTDIKYPNLCINSLIKDYSEIWKAAMPATK